MSKDNINKLSTRNELFKSIWKCADDLRGKVDSSSFKNYIFGFLFYRFISENMIKHFEDECENGYDNLDDDMIYEDKIDQTIEEKGFFIYPSELFSNVLQKYKHDVKDLNIILQNIFNKIQERSRRTEDANRSFKGLFNIIDLNSINIVGSDDVLKKNKHLIKIMENIQNFELSSFEDKDCDIFGDSYEYLMRMYASNAGKSGGEFFTPQSVSQLLTALALADNTQEILNVYDPACGSGSLLLNVSKYNDKLNIKYYGQESEPSTYNLCRMNMFLHNIRYDKFDIQNDDTLINPMHRTKKFNLILSNPPYSIKWEGSTNPNLVSDERFEKAGALAPNSKADFAFIQHILHQLDEKGTAAIVCFPGIFYRNGTEYTIRKWMVESGFVKAIIKLPIDLFYGTSISTNILVLSKNDNPYIKFINAEDLFDRYESKNYLTDENITQILDLFKSSTNVANYLHIAPLQEVTDNDYNLSVENYVKKEVAKEVIDIKVLNEEIKNISLRNNTLRNEINKIIEELENE